MARRGGVANLVFAALSVSVVLYVVGYPLFVVRYPPMTDLPFHASSTSVLRHYWDPAFGFREQFSLHLLEVPYVSMYVIGALFALVLPMHVAVKCAAFVMLALLPAGLAVAFHGMRKTPLWGVLGLAAVWTNLTHWGFLNFMGALGLFAMSVGFALLALDRPSRRHSVGLTLALLGVFFTHIYRFPFALLAVVGVGVVMYPATRRIRPLLLPLAINAAVFGGWYAIRPKDVGEQGAKLALDMTRWREVRDHVVAGFSGKPGLEEQLLFDQLVSVLLVAALCALVWRALLRERRPAQSRPVAFAVGATLLPLLFSAGFALAYFALPMRIGIWWYVYPREATSALLMLLLLVPDMPRAWYLRAPLVALPCFALGRIGFLVAQQYYEFEAATQDFRAMAARVPPRPKLMYLVFDHAGSSRRVTPFIHLPAWIQAEKGGALSFHFSGWNHSPIRYRRDSPAVPPPVPDRWEWTPQRFRLEQHGAFFDTFLVRSSADPSHLFRADPRIHPVAHQDTWWLYQREPAQP
ncbi:MAG: hypothetical protein R3B13_34310 [Polyangiaceae bacterium]